MNTYNWISDFVTDLEAIHGINDLLPNIFDRYFLIPWAVGIIDDFPFSEYPGNKNTIEKLNRQHSIEQGFGIFLNDYTENKYRRVTRQEIAERFQVQYCADTAYLVKETAGIALINGATVQTLNELIHHLQKDQHLHLYAQDDYRFRSIEGVWKYNKQNLIPGPADYLVYQQDTSWDSTSYLFPANKDWCLCTVEDYDHFIFCCKNSSCRSLEDLPGIEAFEVNYHFKFVES